MVLRTNISNKRIQLLFGLMISLFVLTQSATIYSFDKEIQGQATEVDSENEDTEIVYSVNQAIPNSGFHVNLGFDHFLLNELSFEEIKNEASDYSRSLTSKAQTAIGTILRRIISPNAP